MAEENQFYVYVHRRKTDGSIFYVGKGCGNRSASIQGRNFIWKRIVEKHGFNVDICQDFMSEENSLTLEMWIIAKLKYEGIKLANLTEGGEGAVGFKHPIEGRIKMRSAIHCSNGMFFNGAITAIEWLKSNGYPKATQGSLSSCARGERNSAYGFSWWYDGMDIVEYIPRYKRASSSLGTKVINNKGMTFDSCVVAAKWLSLNGYPKASGPNISATANGKFKYAYGYTWKYV